MVSTDKVNRPLKFGAENQHEYIVMDSEVEIRAENDANGNPIYIGRSKTNVDTDEAKWQIQRCTWDGNNSLTALEWPQNSFGVPTTDYTYIWDDRATYTYS